MSVFLGVSSRPNIGRHCDNDNCPPFLSMRNLCPQHSSHRAWAITCTHAKTRSLSPTPDSEPHPPPPLPPPPPPSAITAIATCPGLGTDGDEQWGPPRGGSGQQKRAAAAGLRRPLSLAMCAPTGQRKESARADEPQAGARNPESESAGSRECRRHVTYAPTHKSC